MGTFDARAARDLVDGVWRESIVPALERYITIPNQSPAFDREWRGHGHTQRARGAPWRWSARIAVTAAKAA